MKNDDVKKGVTGVQDKESGKLAMSASGIRLLLVGLIVIVSGFVLMAGGGSDNPEQFNWAMFNFPRMVAAPVLIVAGIVIEIVAIMKKPSSGK